MQTVQPWDKWWASQWGTRNQERTEEDFEAQSSKKTERLSPYAISCSYNLKPSVPLDVNIHHSQSFRLLSPQP